MGLKDLWIIPKGLVITGLFGINDFTIPPREKTYSNRDRKAITPSICYTSNLFDFSTGLIS